MLPQPVTLQHGTSVTSLRGLPRRHDVLIPAQRCGRQRVRKPRAKSAAAKRDAREPIHLRKAGRRKARQELYGTELSVVDSSGLSFLERQSVAPGTLAVYQQVYQEFLGHCRRSRLATRTASQADRAVVHRLHQMFAEGELSAESQKLVSVVKKFRPELRRTGSLPRSLTAIRGFRRLCPPATRQPLPWECACRVAEVLVEDGQWLTAVATLLCFALYARPSELLRLRGAQLIAPLRRAGRAHSCWSVTLHPREHQRPSKTEVFDESLRLDVAPYLALQPALRWLASNTAKGDRVFPFSYAVWSRRFEGAAQRCGLAVLEPTLYQLRHGGASHDAATKSRSTAEIKKRGRWMDDRSLVRYENGGRVTEILRRLTADARRQALASARRIGVILSTRSRLS